jgi:hypothetical protein
MDRLYRDRKNDFGTADRVTTVIYRIYDTLSIPAHSYKSDYLEGVLPSFPGLQLLDSFAKHVSMEISLPSQIVTLRRNRLQ